MTDPALAAAEAAWLEVRDGATGSDFGMMLDDAGLHDEAEAIFAALEADGYIISWWCRAWSAHDRGDDTAAESHMRTYMLRDPSELHAAGTLGIWLEQQGAGGDTEDLLRRGANANEDARGTLGNFLRKAGRLSEAETELRVGYAAGEVSSHITLALLLEEVGQVFEAIDVYREGFALGDAYCAFNLGLLLESEGLELDFAAIDWFAKAARGGDTMAVELLAERGIELVEL